MARKLEAETETAQTFSLVKQSPVLQLQSTAAYTRRRAAEKRLAAEQRDREAAECRAEAAKLDAEAAEYAAAAERLSKPATLAAARRSSDRTG
jgi:hypothetical protein